MIHVLTGKQARDVDRNAIEKEGIPSLELMEAAGRGAHEYLEQVHGELKQDKVLILCGKGNNGGDGMVLARYLKQDWVDTKVACISPLKDLSKDSATMARRFKKIGGKFSVCQSLDDLRRLIEGADVIVDALLGTGLKQAVRSPYKDWIDLANEYAKPILSLDIPSGLSADTGKPLGTCIQADWTATMATMKLGLAVMPGCEYAGEVGVVDIGIPASVLTRVRSPYRIVDHDTVKASLHQRRPDAHKGDAGHVLVVAGSPTKLGAALMTSKSALRIGAGMVTLALPDKAYDKIPSHFLEIMYEPVKCASDGRFAGTALKEIEELWVGKQCLALGPGMGVSRAIKSLVHGIITKSPLPIILDADGINAIQGQSEILIRAKSPVVLTPHPGELARLLGITTAALQKKRLKYAIEFAKANQVTVVLKGYRTITATPEGKAYINPTGNPAMASAGMGDVLTGMIAGLLAQGHEWVQAITGAVYLHGYAGDRLADRMGDRGLIAGDIIDSIPFTLKEFVTRLSKLQAIQH